MSLGYDGKLYILAFDHRGSFQKKMFGIQGDPDPQQSETISDAKHLIYEGMAKVVESGAVPGSQIGVLVDEQFGGPKNIPQEAKRKGLKLAMPVEKSGQDMFDFEYGDAFGEHIETFDPDFVKVLVRYNPDAAGNADQLEKLKRLSDWLHEQPDDSRAGQSGEAGGRAAGTRERKFLFELLVPAEPAQLEQVGGDSDRYDAELRPELMRRAIEEIQNARIEADIWKIEGVDEQSDAEMLAAQTRVGGRDGVACVVLGRGASDKKVDEWLRAGAPVAGYIGFAIGRSIWWDALKGFLDGSIEREAAAQQIADNYLRFIRVYEDAEQGATVA